MGEGLAMRCANGFVLRDDGSASPPGLVATREIISRLPAMLATSEPERMQRRLAELKRGANTQWLVDHEELLGEGVLARFISFRSGEALVADLDGMVKWLYGTFRSGLFEE